MSARKTVPSWSVLTNPEKYVSMDDTPKHGILARWIDDKSTDRSAKSTEDEWFYVDAAGTYQGDK